MLSEDLPVTDQSTGTLHFFLVLPKYILKCKIRMWQPPLALLISPPSPNPQTLCS